MLFFVNIGGIRLSSVDLPCPMRVNMGWLGAVCVDTKQRTVKVRYLGIFRTRRVRVNVTIFFTNFYVRP